MHIFPAKDERRMNIASTAYLRLILGISKERGLKITNLPFLLKVFFVRNFQGGWGDRLQSLVVMTSVIVWLAFINVILNKVVHFFTIKFFL